MVRLLQDTESFPGLLSVRGLNRILEALGPLEIINETLGDAVLKVMRMEAGPILHSKDMVRDIFAVYEKDNKTFCSDAHVTK